MGGSDDRKDTRATPDAKATAEATAKHQLAEDEQLNRKLSRIKHKILVLSGKGGVGKSSVAAGLAVDLAKRGKKVAVLDIDIHGPSIPQLLGIQGERVTGTNESILPVVSSAGVAVMSMGLLLQGSDEAVIWRGPLKYGVIKQFLRDVEWGDLDYLIVDSPPGTGDEPLSVAQLIKGVDGALLVTTPQTVSTNDVRRSIGFSRQLDLPILGVIENMSGFVCPSCGTKVDVFGSGGGASMAEEMGVPFLGSIPIDPEFVKACDTGSLAPFLAGGSPGATAFTKVAAEVIDRVENGPHRETELTTADQAGAAPNAGTTDKQADEGRRIAVPVTGGKLSAHFGHCEEFAIFSAKETSEGTAPVAEAVEVLAAPPHEPGLLPAWLNERGVNMVIAGGMGSRAQQLFSQAGIEVMVGAASTDPKEIVQSYLDGTLVAGQNVCDH
jgi:Mrp family chromosome partitioning ATPase/predicted Fe-Mo cluster-binding NifX family protein